VQGRLRVVIRVLVAMGQDLGTNRTESGGEEAPQRRDVTGGNLRKDRNSVRDKPERTASQRGAQTCALREFVDFDGQLDPPGETAAEGEHAVAPVAKAPHVLAVAPGNSIAERSAEHGPVLFTPTFIVPLPDPLAGARSRPGVANWEVTAAVAAAGRRQDAVAVAARALRCRRPGFGGIWPSRSARCGQVPIGRRGLARPLDAAASRWPCQLTGAGSYTSSNAKFRGAMATCPLRAVRW